jgi:hypothetical protein
MHLGDVVADHSNRIAGKILLGGVHVVASEHDDQFCGDGLKGQFATCDRCTYVLPLCWSVDEFSVLCSDFWRSELAERDEPSVDDYES